MKLNIANKKIIKSYTVDKTIFINSRIGKTIVWNNENTSLNIEITGFSTNTGTPGYKGYPFRGYKKVPYNQKFNRGIKNLS